MGSLRWNHVFGPRLFVNTTVNYTQYRHLLDINGNERYQGGANTDFTLGYNSLINDLSAAADFEFNPVPEHDIRFGGTFIHHTFKPSVTTVRFSESAQKDAAIDTTFGDRNLFTNEAALYAEDNWSITPWLKVNLGLRYSLYATSGRTYHSLEPRVSLRALFTDDFSFKASYSEMSQAVHLLSNSNISLPTDLWVPSTDRIEPMRSKQAAAGLFYSLGVVDLSLEGYYKHMDNVLEYRDGASFFGSTTGWEDKVAMGKGWAYGVEFLVQKKTGRLTGWIGYTWSKTMRQFDREGHVINFGKPFPAKYDFRLRDRRLRIAGPPDDPGDAGLRPPVRLLYAGRYVPGRLSGRTQQLPHAVLPAPRPGCQFQADVPQRASPHHQPECLQCL